MYIFTIACRCATLVTVFAMHGFVYKGSIDRYHLSGDLLIREYIIVFHNPIKIQLKRL